MCDKWRAADNMAGGRMIDIENELTNCILVNGIWGEYNAAVEKHPQFATTLAGAVSILSEEVGEVAMAVNDHCAYGEPLEEVKTELEQVGAVVFRFLLLLEKLEARL